MAQVTASSLGSPKQESRSVHTLTFMLHLHHQVKVTQFRLILCSFGTYRIWAVNGEKACRYSQIHIPDSTFVLHLTPWPTVFSLQVMKSPSTSSMATEPECCQTIKQIRPLRTEEATVIYWLAALLCLNKPNTHTNKQALLARFCFFYKVCKIFTCCFCAFGKSRMSWARFCPGCDIYLINVLAQSSVYKMSVECSQ